MLDETALQYIHDIDYNSRLEVYIYTGKPSRELPTPLIVADIRILVRQEI